MDADVRGRLEAEVKAALDRASREPMRWGVDDCALWCVEPIRRVLGYDPAEQWRGRYKTRAGAYRVLRHVPLAEAIALFGETRGWRSIQPAEALPGDLGVAPTVVTSQSGKEQMALATVMCRAPGWFVGRNETGFAALPARHVQRAWSVQ